MLAHFENDEKDDMKQEYFLPANFENGRFWKRNLKRHILKAASCKHLKRMKTEHFSTLQMRQTDKV